MKIEKCQRDFFFFCNVINMMAIYEIVYITINDILHNFG